MRRMTLPTNYMCHTHNCQPMPGNRHDTSALLIRCHESRLPNRLSASSQWSRPSKPARKYVHYTAIHQPYHHQPTLLRLEPHATSTRTTRYFDSNHTLLRLEPQPTSTRTTRYFDSNHSPLHTLPYRLKTVLGAGEHPSRTATNPLTHRPSNPSPDRALPDYCCRLACHLSRR